MKASNRGFFTAGPLQWVVAGVLALWLLGVGSAQAQVVDDSTKVLYGPKTTRVIYEAEVLRDSTSGTPLDTTLTRWPQARFWFHDTTFQQDLGAVGTASRPLLYRPNLELGHRFGRTAFDKYARNAATVPYYDSRSPYSFFRVVQSGAGEQVFEFSYSRSLKKNLSVGVAYERIASNKISASKFSRDGLVEHSNVLLFGRYQTDDERYHVLFNFSNARHRVIEQGGIRPLTFPKPPTTPFSDDTVGGETRPRDLFNYARERVYLTQAANTEDRDEFYLTHTYRLLGRGLTVYHNFDAKRQYNSYLDQEALTPSSGAALFYPNHDYPNRPAINSLATLDRAEYRQVDNTLGVLGRTPAVEYRLYSRVRKADLVTQTLLPGAGLSLRQTPDAPPRHLAPQVFAGGTAAFNYRKIYAVEAAGEYRFFNEYWLRASVRTGPFSIEALQSSYAPTLTQQQFVGNHYAWHHLPNSVDEFKNTTTTQLTGRLRLALPTFAGLSEQRFEASVAGVTLANLVYYNSEQRLDSSALRNAPTKPVYYNPRGMPEQIGTARTLLIFYARHQARLGRMRFDNQATYTLGGDVEGVRIPALVTDSRAYYQGYIFRKALLAQVGAELYYQSSFRAYDYSPSTQQFYQQDNFTIRNYPILDVFFSADIKSVSVFLKAAYVNQGVLYNGYFASPYYSGYPRRFQLGVRWDFFN